MNKLLDEMSLKAEGYADDTDLPWLATYTQKLTELIVQECVNVLDKAQWDKGEDWVCADGTRIIPQIKEHFGVE